MENTVIALERMSFEIYVYIGNRNEFQVNLKIRILILFLGNFLRVLKFLKDVFL